ncbi:MAG: hypothetical protein DRJ97_06900 [Thermoprotei archaeon]|nr:MAG: hypothetical protein DRJ97_06900 [Thermoprotei archaeon]
MKEAPCNRLVRSLEVAAEARGWPHHRHRQLMEALSRLFAEAKGEGLLKLRAMAEALHANSTRDTWAGRRSRSTLRLQGGSWRSSRPQP